MFAKFIRLALGMSFIIGGTRIITLKPKDIVTGKVFRIGEQGETRPDIINQAREAILEEASSLVKFEDAEPGSYICLVRKENGKFYSRRFRVKQKGSDQVEQIGDDIEFIYVVQFDKSEIIGKCYRGNDVHAAKTAIMEDEDLVSLDEAKKRPGIYIGIVRKGTQEYLREFKIESGALDKIAPDVDFASLPSTISGGSLSSSGIIGNCFEGTYIIAAEKAIKENSKVVAYQNITNHAFHICAIQDKMGNVYLVMFTKQNGVFRPIGLKFPLDWQISTLDQSEIVRGCFKGTDIEQAKLAIREDRGLIPFEAIEDNVFYTCATKDDLDNFYLTSFVRKNGRFIQIGAKILLDWKFLQKIDEMTCNVEWTFKKGETCLAVDTNDLETAINAYITAFACDLPMIPLTDALDDGTYIKKNMIFKIESGRRVFVKRISILFQVKRQRFYEEIRDLMTSDEDKARLAQLVQTPGQRMFAEVRNIGYPGIGEANLGQIGVLNLNLVSTAGGGVVDVRYYSLDPNNIRVEAESSLIWERSMIFDLLFKIKYTRDYHHPMDITQPTKSYVIRHFIHKGQEFIATPSAILYMGAQGQIFSYYDPEYLYKKHKHDIARSRAVLIDYFRLPPPRPR